MRRVAHALWPLRLCLMSLLASPALAAGPVKNWFHDPFFQVRKQVASCPMPLGPFGTEEDMKAQAHSRVERGTSCWQAGQCKKPNAYLYDADIAKDLQRRFAKTRRFADASLWITVQRRFVYVEGCTRNKQAASGIDAFVRQTPDVQLVVTNTIIGTGKPNYPVMPAK